MQKTVKLLSEVFIVIETNKNGIDSILFVEATREDAELDIKHYCENKSCQYRIQIERLYTGGCTAWLEKYD